MCSVVASSIDRVTRAGGEFRGAGWHTEDLQYLASQPKASPVVRAVMDIAPQTVVEKSGADPQRFSGGRVLYTFHLRWANGRWTIAKLERTM